MKITNQILKKYTNRKKYKSSSSSEDDKSDSKKYAKTNKYKYSNEVHKSKYKKSKFDSLDDISFDDTITMDDIFLESDVDVERCINKGNIRPFTINKYSSSSEGYKINPNKFIKSTKSTKSPKYKSKTINKNSLSSSEDASPKKTQKLIKT